MRRCRERMGSGRRSVPLRALQNSLSAQPRRGQRAECCWTGANLDLRANHRAEEISWRLASNSSAGELNHFAVKPSELIYDWNQIDAARLRPAGPVLLNDESLRDGLQSPSVRDPSIAEKIQLLHCMESLGINSLDLGLPGAGPRAVADCEALAREIARGKLKIRANCAARTHENDIRPIAEIVQRTGLNIQ